MKMNDKLKKFLLFFLVLLIGLFLRLYKINSPLADHHSWRQADSASVIRNLATGKFDLFRPKWDNLIASNSKGLPNPNRYFFEDFPISFDIYPALFYKVFGLSVQVLRLPSIIFSLLTILFLGLLVSNFAGFKIGIISAFIYAVLPFSIFFSRGVFQENPLNLYAILALFCLIRFFKKGRLVNFILSIIFNALLFLTKPYALIFLLPEAFLFWQYWKLKSLKNLKFYLYFAISLLPFVLWWLWVSKFPEGIPGSAWLLNEGNIRFKGAFFHWIFAERIGKLILGYYGLIFFGLGLLLLGKGDGLFYFWLFSLFAYVSIIAKGNVTHDYYQIPFLPVIAYFSAKGIAFIHSLVKGKFNKVMSFVMVGIIASFALAFSWYEVRSFYDLKSGVDLAGDFINQNIPAKSLIIAGDGADPTLLYNCNRKGWTVGYGSGMENTSETIETLRQKGANYYVTTTVGQIKGTTFEKYIRSRYPVVKETNQFIVFDLKTK